GPPQAHRGERDRQQRARAGGASQPRQQASHAVYARGCPSTTRPRSPGGGPERSGIGGTPERGSVDQRWTASSAATMTNSPVRHRAYVAGAPGESVPAAPSRAPAARRAPRVAEVKAARGDSPLPPSISVTARTASQGRTSAPSRDEVASVIPAAANRTRSVPVRSSTSGRSTR